MDTSVKMKRGLRRVEWGTSLGVLCDVIRRKWAVLMLEGAAFQGWFTLKGNEEKIIDVDVECGCGCRDGAADPKDCLMAKAIMGRKQSHGRSRR